LRTPVGLLPQLLRARPAEQLTRAVLGKRPEAAGDGARQRAGARRPEDLLQDLLDVSLNVDVRVQLIDQENGDLIPDVVVLEQLGARIDPVVGVEDLAVGPDGKDRQEAQQRRATAISASPSRR
jgi:hypothetical protein